MIRVTDQYFWNFVFGLFFLVLVILGAIILESESRVSLAELTLLDFTLMTLASWRLTRLFVYDSITKWFREQFYDVKKVGKGYTLEKPKFGARRTIADLLTCPWCFGMWAGTSVVFFYLLTPYAVYIALFLSISAVASLLQITSNLIGNKAEQAREAAEK